jgi:hypothetical protein
VFWVTIGSNTNLHLTLINLFSVVGGLWLQLRVSSYEEGSTVGKQGIELGVSWAEVESE